MPRLPSTDVRGQKGKQVLGGAQDRSEGVATLGRRCDSARGTGARKVRGPSRIGEGRRACRHWKGCRWSVGRLGRAIT